VNLPKKKRSERSETAHACVKAEGGTRSGGHAVERAAVMQVDTIKEAERKEARRRAILRARQGGDLASPHDSSQEPEQDLEQERERQLPTPPSRSLEKSWFSSEARQFHRGFKHWTARLSADPGQPEAPLAAAQAMSSPSPGGMLLRMFTQSQDVAVEEPDPQPPPDERSDDAAVHAAAADAAEAGAAAAASAEDDAEADADAEEEEEADHPTQLGVALGVAQQMLHDGSDDDDDGAATQGEAAPVRPHRAAPALSLAASLPRSHARTARDVT
jgi:hypothetical protein